MVNDTLSKLIRLYASNSATELEDLGDLYKREFGLDRDALLKNREFGEQKQIVKEQRQFIETLEGRYLKKNNRPLGDPKAQLVECLKGLLNKALFTESTDALYSTRMDILYKLMLAKYADADPPWPGPYRQHLEFLHPRIRDWNLFFFSYTNDGAGILNNEYKEVIKGLIESKKLDPLYQHADENRDSNLLAEIIVQLLKRNNIARGFYDRAGIGVGEREIPETIKSACSTSFLFIQLVTRDSFVYCSKNWPFQEYELFSKANEELTKIRAGYKALQKRFLFALAGGKLEEITPKFMPIVYDNWHAHIAATHYEAPNNDPRLFQDAVDKIALAVLQLLETAWIEEAV